MERDHAVLFFGAFCLCVVLILLLDLLVIGKKKHVLSFREAILWTSVWVALALLFYVFLLFHAEKLHGIRSMEHLIHVRDRYAPFLQLPLNDFSAALSVYRKNLAIEYLTGYVIEYSLSIDNIFVMMMILSSFSVKEQYYKEVLFWGILGAIILRCLFIFIGSALIQRFEWILMLFGIFLLYSGAKAFFEHDHKVKTEPQNHWLVKWLSNHIPVFQRYVSGNFFIVENGKLFITPLLIVLILIEFTDLIFAFDSIPAVFSVTRDPFVVFFSNILAIIGLRSLFFLIMRVVNMFHYLKAGVAILLIFVGLKLLFHNWLDRLGLPTYYSLLVILSIIVLSILFSVIFPKKGNVH